jgi:hypothetical protein
VSVTSENWTGMVRQIIQLPYFHDLAPCHFFLFGYLKKEWDGTNDRFENQVISAVRPIFEATTIKWFWSNKPNHWLQTKSFCAA